MPLAKPTKPDAITAVPTPVPLRTDRANFAARGDAMMGWFPDGVDEINDTSDYMDDAANFAEQEANEAEASATAAAASNVAAAVNAAAAAASAGATVWVTGTTYAAGNVRYSPTNYQTYRDTAGGVSNTDPASDTTGRWISAMLPSAEAIGLPAMPPTAVFNFASGVIDRRFVELRSTAGTRYNIFGNLETLAAGVAKPTYDPATNECNGYLAEPAATYLAMRSTEMDNGSYWLTTNVTITPAAAIGIDGALSMFKVETVATTTTNFQRTATATASTGEYTIRVKKGSGATDANRFAVYNNTTAADLASLTINYDTGVVTQGVGSGATATAIGHDGIWELRIPITSGMSASDTMVFYACHGGAPGTAGQYAYVGFPDVADKPNLAHIPTEGSNVPTVAGGLIMDLTAHDDIVNPQGFTVVCAFDGDVMLRTSGLDQVIFSAGVSPSDIIYISHQPFGEMRFIVRAGGVTLASMSIGDIAAGRNVVAASFQAGQCLASLTGNAAVVAATASSLPNFASLHIGGYGFSSGFEAIAPIHLAAIYPRACTAGELQAFVNNF